MFNYKKLGAIALGCAVVVGAQADDLEIFAGQVIEASAPVELLFAVDTSGSMGCTTAQDQSADCIGTYLRGTDGSKAITIKSVLSSLFNDSSVLADDIHVGLAYYNEPGGSVVQPLRALSDNWDVGDGVSHRSVLIDEINSLTPGGGTPILGTLLELGQYLQSAPVISGTARKSSPFVSVDEVLWSEDDVQDIPGVSGSARVGDVARISHRETIQSGTSEYQASDNACISSVGSNEAVGQRGAVCISENYGADTVYYNQDINRASICASSEDADEEVTTQIFLITDGLPTQEQMGLRMQDAYMGTWVKRFVLGDQEAEGFLVAGEGVDNSEDPLPENAQYTDLGCMVTGNVNPEHHEDDISEIFDDDAIQSLIDTLGIDQTIEQVRAFLLAQARSVPAYRNIIPGDTINILGSSDSYEIPSFERQKELYDSCLFRIANRFRELGVKINVIGFDIDDADGVDNSLLRKIAYISGGQFFSTDSAAELSAFISSTVASGVESAGVSAALAPSVSVNPGSILANSNEVYYPIFKADSNSFLYGNLKKFRVESSVVDGVATTSIVDANGDEATETCERRTSSGDLVGQYVCFSDDSRSIWSNETDGAIVTKGGSAAEQGIFGQVPDGGRRVFLQNDDELESLELISLTGGDFVSVGDSSSDGGSSSGPDASAYAIDSANQVTKDYFAQLVPLPELPTNTFANYAALEAHTDADSLKLNVSAHNMMRWLLGVDHGRFGADGVYNALLALDGSGLTERDLLVDGDGESLAPVVPADSDLERSRLFYGAVIHSQPTVVNYSYRQNGDDLEYDNAVFVSGNDGFLRILDADTGAEHSSFFPASLIKNIPTMYERRQGDLAYGLDATWTPWRQDLPDSEGVMDGRISGDTGFSDDGHGFVRLYGGMRRGGRSYYFLDVTDREQPSLMAELKGGDVNSGTDAFARMGQTWSQPTLAKIKIGGAIAAVAAFGGGYDPDYDLDAENANTAQGPCANREGAAVICGNQIYVVRAGGYASNEDTDNVGDVVWWASSANSGAGNYTSVSNMNHSIPSTFKVMDINGDGLTDRMYVGDLGGQVFRVNIDNSGDNSVFSVVTIAQFGDEGNVSSSDSDNRAFFEQPSAAVMNDGLNRYVGVALASGWRENPKETTVADQMYFIRDNLSPTDDWTTLRQPSNDDQAGTPGFVLPLTDSSDVNAFHSARGFSVALELDGEKAFGSPIILFGNVFWSTYIPPSAAEVSSSEAECVAPPQRSRVSFVRAQRGSQELVLNDDGTISKVTRSESDLPVVYHTQPELSVPLSGLGVHLSSDSISVMAGTKALAIDIDNETIKKTSWEQLLSGSEAIPDDAVSSSD